MGACVRMNPIVKLGVHVSIAGKIYEAIDRGKALGCNTIQIFTRSPRMWEAKKIAPEDAREFQRRLRKSTIFPVFIHVPYLTNLASPERIVFQNSIRAYIEFIHEAEHLGIKYLVTHMGSHKKAGEENGLGRLTRAINIILERTKKSNVELLLENTAGAGSWLGYRFDHHRQVIDGIKDKSRVGICLDTCHAYSAGYDIATKEGLDRMVREIETLVGLSKLKLIHLNDTKDPFNSRRDRHESIGEGTIGLKALGRIVNHSSLREIPFILETPKMTYREDLKNLRRVKGLYGLHH